MKVSEWTKPPKSSLERTFGYIPRNNKKWLAEHDKQIITKLLMPYDVESIEELVHNSYEKGRAEMVEKFNDKVNYLKGSYVDACNMCTKIECNACAVNSIIEDLEQLKEQNGKNNNQS